MTEHPDHIDHIAICPHCVGLAVTRMERIGEVTSSDLTLGDGTSMTFTEGTIYVGPPLPDDCAKDQP